MSSDKFVDVGDSFVKSSKCTPYSDCVEVTDDASAKAHEGDAVMVDGRLIPGAVGKVLVRDSKDKTGTGHIFKYTPEQWREFITEVARNGGGWPLRSWQMFAEPDSGQEPVSTLMYEIWDPEYMAENAMTLHEGRHEDVPRLYFTRDEWDAFVDGILLNEFAPPSLNTGAVTE
jgi:hypothetical protein